MSPHSHVRRGVWALLALATPLAFAIGCESILGVGDLTERAGADATISADSGPVEDSHSNDVTDVTTADASDSELTDADAAPGDSGFDAGCTLGSTRCTPSGYVEACNDGGSWNDAGQCGGNTPVCSQGSCLAPSKDGGATTPPSCQSQAAGTSNCGPGGSGIESCCASLEVPGGAFDRAPTDGGAEAGAPATVSDFRLDKYEVTVGRFRQFVHAWTVGYMPVAGSGKHVHLNGGQGVVNAGAEAGVAFEPGWLETDAGSLAPTDENLACGAIGPPWATWTPAIGPRESKPMNCETWAEAYAFCIWDGGFLPSAAEWEYAAAGGSLEHPLPWGGADAGTDNAHAIYGCYYPSGAPGLCVDTSNIARVGTASLGAGAWGQFDLVGNVEEWVMDGAGGFVTPCSDCANIGPSPYTWLAGNGFAQPLTPLWNFWTHPPTGRSTYDGFRCARAP